MSDRSTKRQRGFSLIEMMIAMIAGTVVMGGAVQLYSMAVSSTWTVSQRSELQQDFRAASDMMTRDLSLAGAGLNDGAAIQLPSAAIPVYGCDTTGACHLGTTNTVGEGYPLQGGVPYLYGLLPGYNLGPTLANNTAGFQTTDVVTVVYTDNSFYLDCYTATVNSAVQVTFVLPATTSVNCTSPTGNAGAQAINDAAVGLTAGDLVLFTFGTTNLVAEVTVTPGSGVVTFGAGDHLGMNQAAGAGNDLASIAVGKTGYATRIQVITYYLDNTVSPTRLMREVSGHTPMPVADGIVYMKFSYDLFNNTTNAVATNQCNPGDNVTACNLLNNSTGSAGLLPDQITKINILHMSMDSTVKGAKGFQGLDLETSVSARDLTYNNKYPLPSH